MAKERMSEDILEKPEETKKERVTQSSIGVEVEAKRHLKFDYAGTVYELKPKDKVRLPVALKDVLVKRDAVRVL